jgi:hypothetical protein
MNILGKVSFLGHSMGGLVLRAALPYLDDFKKYFHSFTTFATPHAGYSSSKSKLVSIGMWALSKFTTKQCLSEIRLSDNKMKEELTLYKLSQYDGLQWFKHVLLVGSSVDTYSPLDSALIQFSEHDPDNKIYTNLHATMKK